MSSVRRRDAHLVYAVVNMTKRTLFLGLALSLTAGLAAVPPVVLDASKLNPADVKKGVAVLAEGSSFLWAVDAEKRPILFIDGNAPCDWENAARLGLDKRRPEFRLLGTAESEVKMLRLQKVHADVRKEP